MAGDARRDVVNARDRGLAGDGSTNDQPALAALVDDLGAAYARDGVPRVIWCPPGIYAIRDAGTVWRSGVSLIGAGPGATRFALSNPGSPGDPTPLAYFTQNEHRASPENSLADCTFSDFEIDGSGVQLAEYDVLAKGLGLQYVMRGRFRDLYIHDTGATGFGCDFLQDTLVENIVALDCGRLAAGEAIGSAGIGIGIGGWGANERLTVTSCTAVGNAMNGVFVELQKDTWPPPRSIRITDCHVERNRFGISDWGADGLIVSGCTMIGNLEAGYDVSSRGTSRIAGRGGIVTACVIDANVGDGLRIGNTTGPYALRGNRISNNGRYGLFEHNHHEGNEDPAREIVVEDNDVWGNALDGVRVGAAMTDAMLSGNRIRNNGRRCAPDAEGAGPTVSYGPSRLVDTAASWRPDGHRGKVLKAGGQQATVVANTVHELRLAPRRPGMHHAWTDGVPADGTPYRLPASPDVRPGITVDAAAIFPAVRANRVWDSQDEPTQTHGLWITVRGSCQSGRVEDNDLERNAVAAVRFDTAPVGGSWARNHGPAETS